jgi:hypothetical protein
MKLLAIVLMLPLAGCANYAGPRVDFTVGYNGASMGVSLYGKQPVPSDPSVSSPISLAPTK